ncbi:MAG: UDP-N-acetylmuramate dehydrogenase [Alphaproteobacteria bacterium]
MSQQGLVDRLPQVRGRYQENVPLSKTTWFRVGGCAEVIFKPADVEDLSTFLSEVSDDIPVHVVGVGSNLLVRDGGIPGVVVRLGRGFSNMMVTDDVVDVGCGVLDRNVALACIDEGIAGLEFFCGIPGTVGGALRMNAGCYGTEVKDVLIEALALDRKGKYHKVTAEDCQFSYRHCGLPKDWIFIYASFKGRKSTSAEVQETVNTYLTQREESQPIRTRTGGSTFANPEGHSAWKLIDEAGCRGLQIGGAQVSEKHCNFMINTGTASADDIETLGETVRKKVQENSGIELKWEIQRIGTPDSTQATCKEKAA